VDDWRAKNNTTFVLHFVSDFISKRPGHDVKLHPQSINKALHILDFIKDIGIFENI